MKIDLRKLTGAREAVIPFSETLDLREEKLYGAKPFQTPVQISGARSLRSIPQPVRAVSSHSPSLWKPKPT